MSEHTEDAKFGKQLWRQVVSEEEWKAMVRAVQFGLAMPLLIVEVQRTEDFNGNSQ